MAGFIHSDAFIMDVVTIVLCAGAALGPRLWSHRVDRWVSWAIAIILIGNEIVYVAHFIVLRSWTPQVGLPLYLCDAAAFVGGVALVTRLPILIETVYFWAFAGTLQGILTPDIGARFLSYAYLQYYCDHIGVMVAAAYLIIGLRYAPRSHALWKVLGITLAFSLFDGIVDYLTRSDYMYIFRLPATKSLLNYFGPWPWYLLTALIVAVIFFHLLDLPFIPRRRREAAARVHLNETLSAES